MKLFTNWTKKVHQNTWHRNVTWLMVRASGTEPNVGTAPDEVVLEISTGKDDNHRIIEISLTAEESLVLGNRLIAAYHLVNGTAK